MFFKTRYRKMADATQNNPLNKNDTTVKNTTSDNPSSQSKNPIDVSSEPPIKRQRFEPSTSKMYDSTWDLPDDLAEYVNDKISTHMKDSDLQEAILLENPIPSNVWKCKKLDSSFKELLEEQSKKPIVLAEDCLSTIEQKILNVFGPLSRMWASLEEEKQSLLSTTSENSLPKEEIEHMDFASTVFDQTITC